MAFVWVDAFPVIAVGVFIVVGVFAADLSCQSVRKRAIVFKWAMENEGGPLVLIVDEEGFRL